MHHSQNSDINIDIKKWLNYVFYPTCEVRHLTDGKSKRIGQSQWTTWLSAVRYVDNILNYVHMEKI